DSSFITNESQSTSYNNILRSESSNLSMSLYNNFIDLTTDLIESANSTITSSEITDLAISTNTTSSSIITNENLSDSEIPEIEIIDQDDDLNEISEISYNYFTKKLHISEIRYSPISIEYPSTSLEGIATIYNVSEWDDFNSAFSDVSSGGKKLVECEFLGCKVYKSVRICTGAKICEFASDELRNATHTEVNESIDFYKINQPVDSQTSIEAKIHAKYLAFVNTQCPYNSNTCSRKLQVCRYGKKSDNDILSYFISCSAWRLGQKHIHYKINDNKINIKMLGKLFKGTFVDLDKPVQNCRTILFTNSRKKECSYFHCTNEGLNRKGKIIKLDCNVQFIKLIPVDIINTPFVVLICKGIHTHPPPLPVNIPFGIKVNLERMIKEATQTFEKRTLKVKPKSAKKQKKTTKQINIQESDDDNIKNLEDLEVKERRLAIKEKEIALNERETELELKKLQ
ncbi:11061_t:CDS:2, partial [Scutellospora calospora]